MSEWEIGYSRKNWRYIEFLSHSKVALESTPDDAVAKGFFAASARTVCSQTTAVDCAFYTQPSFCLCTLSQVRFIRINVGLLKKYNVSFVLALFQVLFLFIVALCKHPRQVFKFINRQAHEIAKDSEIATRLLTLGELRKEIRQCWLIGPLFSTGH